MRPGAGEPPSVSRINSTMWKLLQRLTSRGPAEASSPADHSSYYVYRVHFPEGSGTWSP